MAFTADVRHLRRESVRAVLERAADAPAMSGPVDADGPGATHHRVGAPTAIDSVIALKTADGVIGSRSGK